VVAVAEFSPALAVVAGLVVVEVFRGLALVADLQIMREQVTLILPLAVAVGAHQAVMYQRQVVVLRVALAAKLLHLIATQSLGSVATQQGFTGAFHERHNNYQRTCS
jgi:hypothetical protein